MKKTFLATLLVIGMSSSDIATASGNHEADIMLKKAFSAEVSQDYPGAEKEYIAVIGDLQRKKPGGVTILRAQARLARVYILQGKFDNAEGIFKSLISAPSSIVKDDPELMVDLDDLSDAYLKLQNNNHYGYESLKRSLVLRRYINPNHPHICESYRQLSQFCMRCSNYKDAITWILKTIEIEQNSPLNKQGNLVIDMAFLGGLYFYNNQFELAQKTADDTLAKIKKCACSKVMISQMHMLKGRVYSHEKRFDDAEREFKLALERGQGNSKTEIIAESMIKIYRQKNDELRKKSHSRR